MNIITVKCKRYEFPCVQFDSIEDAEKHIPKSRMLCLLNKAIHTITYNNACQIHLDTKKEFGLFDEAKALQFAKGLRQETIPGLYKQYRKAQKAGDGKLMLSIMKRIGDLATELATK